MTELARTEQPTGAHSSLPRPRGAAMLAGIFAYVWQATRHHQIWLCAVSKA